MAAVDKVAKATTIALAVKPSDKREVDGAFKVLGHSLPAVRVWYDDKIGRDLRCIRVRVAHYTYCKSPANHRWRVESPGRERDYGGSRELLSYASAGVDYGMRLDALLNAIASELSLKGSQR